MWHRLLDRLDDTLLLMAVSLIFALIRTVVQPSARSVRFYLSAFLVSIPVGTLAGQLARDWGFTDTGCFLATAIASLLAQDLVTAVLKNSNLIDLAIKRLVDKWSK